MRAFLRNHHGLASALAAALIGASPAAADMTRPSGVKSVDVKAATAVPAEPVGTSRSELSVTVDRAKVIRLPENAQTVVIGNAAIADISVQKNGVAVLTGKSYGVTNMIALDAGGALLAESVVTVTAPNDSVVVVQRGLDRQSYSCTPNCQPAVVLGDATSYFSETKGQADQHGQFASGGAPAPR